MMDGPGQDQRLFLHRRPGLCKLLEALVVTFAQDDMLLRLPRLERPLVGHQDGDRLLLVASGLRAILRYQEYCQQKRSGSSGTRKAACSSCLTG